MLKVRLSTVGLLQIRLLLVSLLLNFAIEASIVFLPLYASNIGASKLYIGLITASYGLSFFLSSLIFGRQSDKNGRVVYIHYGLGLSVIAYLAQIITSTPVELLLVRGLVGFSLGITSAAVMAYTYENQKKVGGFASYGSLGWLLGAVAAAVLNNYEALFLSSAIASAIAFLVSFTFREEKNIYSYSRIGSPPAMKQNSKILFSFFLRQLAANAIWAIMPLYLASIGASKSWIAVLDGINMGMQFIIMQFIDRFNPVKLFRIGLLSSAVVFIIYGVATDFMQLIPVQVLLALAWSCIFLGAFTYLFKNSKEKGTISGLMYSTMYLSAGIGPFLGGVVAQVWGYATLMCMGAGLSVYSLANTIGLSSVKNETIQTNSKERLLEDATDSKIF